MSEAKGRLNDHGEIDIPFPEPGPTKDVKLKFAFAKPANINVVGSYARRTHVPADGTTTVDLAVTMPSVSVT